MSGPPVKNAEDRADRLMVRALEEIDEAIGLLGQLTDDAGHFDRLRFEDVIGALGCSANDLREARGMLGDRDEP